MKNGYPKIVVERTIASVIERQGVSKATVIDVPKLKSAELSIVFKAGSTIGQSFPFKDIVPQLMRYFVLYKITCDACGASYIG